MPTTTNFGWTTPADTDLVKDGALAIRTLANGIDTSLVDLKGGTSGQYLIKNSNTDLDFTWTTNTADIDGITATSPLTGGGTSGTITVGIQDGTTAQKGAVQLTDSTSSTSTTTAATPNSVKSAYDLANGAIPKTLTTTTGDIIYASSANTPARLGIGSSGQVLTVSGGIPSWGAAGSGALTKITSSSFTSASSVTVDSVFNSTYKRYAVFLRYIFITDPGDLRWQFRYSGTTESSANYYGAGFRQNRSNTKTDYGFTSGTYATVDTGGQTNGDSILWMYIDRVGNASETPVAFQQGQTANSQSIMQSSILLNQARTYTGFILTPSAGTLTGDYAVYGVQN